MPTTRPPLASLDEPGLTWQSCIQWKHNNEDKDEITDDDDDEDNAGAGLTGCPENAAFPMTETPPPGERLFDADYHENVPPVKEG